MTRNTWAVFLAALGLLAFASSGLATNLPSTIGNSAGSPAYTQDGNTSGSISGSNPMQTAAVDGAQIAFTCSATCSTTNGGVLAGPVDASTGIGQIVVQISSVGSGNTTLFEASEDNTNWRNDNCQRDDALLTQSVAGTTRYVCATGRYFRIRNSVYSSGTISGTVSLRARPQAITYQNLTTPTSQYPYAAVPITASATGTTAATTATLAGTASKTTYICGFSIGADATAFAVGTATVTGTVTGTLSFRQAAGAAASQTSQTSQTFSPCVPASATNTGIAVNSIAAGSGGNTTVFAWGYQL